MRVKRAEKPRFLVLRRNTGELVLSAEANLTHGFGGHGPQRKHAVYACYSFDGSPHSVTIWQDRTDGPGREPVIHDPCPCDCHSAKGKRAWAKVLREYKAARQDPATVEISFAGSSSKAINVARRVRRVSADKQRRLLAIQTRIAKLQREHTALITTLWGDGEVLTGLDVMRLADVKHGKRGGSIHDVETSMEPHLNVAGPVR